MHRPSGVVHQHRCRPLSLLQRRLHRNALAPQRLHRSRCLLHLPQRPFHFLCSCLQRRRRRRVLLRPRVSLCHPPLQRVLRRLQRCLVGRKPRRQRRHVLRPRRQLALILLKLRSCLRSCLLLGRCAELCSRCVLRCCLCLLLRAPDSSGLCIE